MNLEKKDKSIAILGLGGVGGFLGAKLLSGDRPAGVEISFVARRKTLEFLQEKGLEFESGEQKISIHPDRIQESGNTSVPFDVVILATKAPGLVTAVQENQGLFSDKTLVIPLQNMVDAASRIRSFVKGAEVLDACIYLISNVVRPGRVKHLGGPGKIVAGLPLQNDYQWFFSLLEDSGVPVKLTPDIQLHLWRKFLFISSLGCLSAAFGVSFGQVKSSPQLIAEWRKLMQELVALARADGVGLTDEDLEVTLSLLSNFPYGSKSSFQLDVEQGNEGEKAILLDEVIEKSWQVGLRAVNYQSVGELIEAKIQEYGK
ncbi:ketopantoate reductase family protein [Cyclobacterium jeungdonense]|uniref:2-dehydropantoate 2-reductase n=1 Tax=Cyclobacterium jeungdonense TaxID=708087 RepID=A0ABT8CBQ4_9BACT|nr:2-dehydropantoate 2-reductase [Cyclobacterium jeungdonense]MDN3689822.1 2-dehydropantoate 2-reductase [Cyclobacterium jeungdonense]